MWSMDFGKFVMGWLVLVQFQQDVTKEGEEIRPTVSRLVEPTQLANKECLRILDGESWAAFWKEHSREKAPAPPVDFSKDMVLILPLELPNGEAIVLRTLMIRQTDESLRFLLTFTTAHVGAIRPGDPPGFHYHVTLAVVPRSKKKVEFFLVKGKTIPPVSKLIQTVP
jgi:hypothetical protein